MTSWLLIVVFITASGIETNIVGEYHSLYNCLNIAAQLVDKNETLYKNVLGVKCQRK